MARPPDSGGAFAEYTTRTGDEVTHKPESFSYVEAAGIPMTGQTAFHALYEEGGPDPGDRLLVHAAAGGVGHLAVQFAANTGAHVTGTPSGRNEEFLYELGVDRFINYREKRFEDVLDEVDVVPDGVGGDAIGRSVEVVRHGGTVVTLPEPPSEEAAERYRDEHGFDVRFFDIVMDSDPTTVQEATERIESGSVSPRVSETYPLPKVQDTLERNADGHVRGKLVVDLV
jgi:NADPH:quinone reductase-like Zn-dependent oxidoreductase